MRWAAFGLAAVISLTVLLGWAAGVDVSSPLWSQTVRTWNGTEFRVVMGGAAEDGTRLRVGTVGENRTALQSVALNGIDAAENPILRYRFEQFPHTLELSLVFRRAGDEDVSVVSLPWPGEGEAAFDLASVPEWKGRITELAFAEYPTPQVVAPTQGFEPFTLVGGSLSSRSWSGDFAALATDWLGHWAWSQRSVHALGRDTDTPRAQSLVLCLALAVGIVVFWAWVFLRPGRVALVRLTLGLGIGAWFLLDAHWLAGLEWREAGTRKLYAQFDWPDRELHAVDADIAQVALDLKAQFRDLPESTHILVHSGSSFSTLRLIYHLLPLNVGVLVQARSTNGSKPLPPGTLIVVYAADGWIYNAAVSRLEGGGLRFRGDVVMQRDKLLVLRTRGQP